MVTDPRAAHAVEPKGLRKQRQCRQQKDTQNRLDTLQKVIGGALHVTEVEDAIEREYSQNKSHLLEFKNTVTEI